MASNYMGNSLKEIPVTAKERVAQRAKLIEQFHQPQDPELGALDDIARHIELFSREIIALNSAKGLLQKTQEKVSNGEYAAESLLPTDDNLFEDAVKSLSSYELNALIFSSGTAQQFCKIWSGLGLYEPKDVALLPGVAAEIKSLIDRISTWSSVPSIEQKLQRSLDSQPITKTFSEVLRLYRLLEQLPGGENLPIGEGKKMLLQRYGKMKPYVKACIEKCLEEKVLSGLKIPTKPTELETMLSDVRKRLMHAQIRKNDWTELKTYLRQRLEEKHSRPPQEPKKPVFNDATQRYEWKMSDNLDA